MLPALERPAPVVPGLTQRAAALAPRVLELALLALVLAAGVVDFVVTGAADGSLGTVPGSISLLATLASCVFVVVRHRAPLPSVVVLSAGVVAYVVLRHEPGLLGLGNRFHLGDRDDLLPFTAPVVALGGMIVPLVRTAPPRIALLAGGLLVGTSGLLLTLPTFWLARALLGAGFAAVCGVSIGGAGYLRSVDQQGRVAADLARRDERLDLARELHDLVAHYVTGIVVQAQAARVVADRDPAAAGEALDKIEAAGRDALTSIRAMVGSLREDVPVVPLAGLDGLHDLAANARTAGLAVDVTIDAEVTGLLAATVHRIVQEALTNVRRHAAGATHVRISVTPDADAVVVTVRDDGRLAGAAPNAAGYGIVGMQERAAAVGGTLRAGPVEPPARGWEVVARLPA